MSLSISNDSIMNVFDFDPNEYAGRYGQLGYVNIKNGVHPEFVRLAQQTAQRLVEQSRSLKEWEFKGKKQQYLFDFPAFCDFPDGIKRAVAAVTGLDEAKLTLCERHIKVYDESAAPYPPPHKDRVASEVAVGIPLVVPEKSVMILYSHDLAGINPYNTTAALRRSLDDEDLPERKLANCEATMIDTQPGDVVMFRGSALYHERHHPAGTVMLYLKFNAMRLDPLGEDPATPVQRDHSAKLLESLGDDALLNCVIEVSPRLEGITRTYTRLHWKEVLQAHVNGEKEFTISEDELQLFRNTDGVRTIRQVLETLAVSVDAHGLASVRRLIRLRGIDILGS